MSITQSSGVECGGTRSTTPLWADGDCAYAAAYTDAETTLERMNDVELVVAAILFALRSTVLLIGTRAACQ